MPCTAGHLRCWCDDTNMLHPKEARQARLQTYWTSYWNVCGSNVVHYPPLSGTDYLEFHEAASFSSAFEIWLSFRPLECIYTRGNISLPQLLVTICVLPEVRGQISGHHFTKHVTELLSILDSKGRLWGCCHISSHLEDPVWGRRNKQGLWNQKTYFPVSALLSLSNHLTCRSLDYWTFQGGPVTLFEPQHCGGCGRQAVWQIWGLWMLSCCHRWPSDKGDMAALRWKHLCFPWTS